MKRFVMLGLIMGTVSCSSMTAHVDFDRQAAFNTYETYAWAPTKDTSMEDSSAMMHNRVVDAIQQKMDQGLKRVDSNPDLYVTYHTNSRDELRMDTTSMGYGYGGGWGWDPYYGGRYGWGYGGMGGMGMGSTTTRVTTYTKGTLVIDIYDAKKKEIIWRGSVEDVVKDDPTKASKQIYQAIDKISEAWQKQKKKAGIE